MIPGHKVYIAWLESKQNAEFYSGGPRSEMIISCIYGVLGEVTFWQLSANFSRSKNKSAAWGMIRWLDSHLGRDDGASLINTRMDLNVALKRYNSARRPGRKERERPPPPAASVRAAAVDMNSP